MELLPGTLDMLILKALSLEPLHGYGVLLRIEQVAAQSSAAASSDKLQVPQGSLYPALYRIERQGWIQGKWGTSENKRSARYYHLTPAGRRQLRAEEAKWHRMSAVIAGILRATPEEA